MLQSCTVNKLPIFKLDSLEVTLRMTFGVLVSALGFAVLIGWYINNVVLIPFSAELIPMQFNTALGMLLSGLSILFLKNHKKILALFSASIFLISILTLLQYIFGITIGVDQLLIKAVHTTNILYPGRMAPNTAVCFLFTSMMFFISAFSNHFAWRNVVAMLLCTVIGILGLISLSGYFFGVPMLYAWGNMAAMAMYTAVGFVGISLGCFLFIVKQFLKIETRQHYLLTIIICAVCIPLLLISWQALTMYQDNLIKAAVEKETVYGDDMLKLLLSNRPNEVTRLFLRGKYHDHYKADSLKFDDIFSTQTWKNYGIELKDHHAILFSKNSHGATAAFRKQWGMSKRISILGQQWNLEIWPNEAVIKARTALFPQSFLLFGLLLAILLVIAVRLWELSVYKNKLLKQYAINLAASRQELEKRARALQESNDMLESFAYAASHDLKAPLRVIDNVSKWLEEDLAPHLTPETRENMNLLRGRVMRMEKLLDDLLEYSRIGRILDERFSEMISGDTLMTSVLELLGPSKKFLISMDPYFSKIILPRMPLQQIFMNLINNAIKHHDKTDGHIDVSVKEDERYYIFSVKDDGPGISAEFHEKVFNMFQTLKPRDLVEGSGMGLAMVKKNVEIFGGTVHLESAIGSGSTFIFTWPKKIRARA